MPPRPAAPAGAPAARGPGAPAAPQRCRRRHGWAGQGAGEPAGVEGAGCCSGMCRAQACGGHWTRHRGRAIGAPSLTPSRPRVERHAALTTLVSARQQARAAHAQQARAAARCGGEARQLSAAAAAAAAAAAPASGQWPRWGAAACRLGPTAAITSLHSCAATVTAGSVAALRLRRRRPQAAVVRAANPVREDGSAGARGQQCGVRQGAVGKQHPSVTQACLRPGRWGCNGPVSPARCPKTGVQPTVPGCRVLLSGAYHERYAWAQVVRPGRSGGDLDSWAALAMVRVRQSENELARYNVAQSSAGEEALPGSRPQRRSPATPPHAAGTAKHPRCHRGSAETARSPPPSGTTDNVRNTLPRNAPA